MARPCLLVSIARDVAVGPHLAPAGRLRFRNDGRQRRRLRDHLAREAVAEPAVHARRPAAIRLRVDRHRRRNRMQAQLARAAFEEHAGRLHRQRRHRIGLGARRIEGAGAGEARHADLPLDLGVVGLEIGVGDRPVSEAGAGNRAEHAALDEVDLVEAPVVGRVVQACATDRASVPESRLELLQLRLLCRHRHETSADS